jgi:transposase, IS6 family
MRSDPAAHRALLGAAPSAFAGFRFPPDVIVVAVRWYLRFGLSYRDVEGLAERR